MNLLNFFFIFFITLSIQSNADLRCFNIQRGDELNKNDYILESATFKDNKIQKKIYIKKNGLISKKKVESNADFIAKEKKNLVIKDEFLIDFIMSKKMTPETVYEVSTQSGTAHFKMKDSKSTISKLEVETKGGQINLDVRNNGFKTEINKISFLKSNLSLLPCDLETRAKIFENKDVNLFIGEKIAQAVHK